VVVRRALSDRRGPAAPFSTIAFRVDDDPAVRCALLAATDATRLLGMQRMRGLRGYDAMIFAFDEPTTTSFINHFVPIDLSIGWYDSTGRLVDHTTMEKCPSGEKCPTYASRDPFSYAVETPLRGLESLGLTHSGATLNVGGAC
jgi:uncharacterized membrane protein (UPF0127 family)